MFDLWLNLCSGVTNSPPKVGGDPQRGEGVCTALCFNITYTAVSYAPVTL